MHSTQHKCVTLVPIFNHLNPEQLDEVMAVAHATTYEKGEMIYRADESSDSLYIVSQGKIRIYRLAESGKEQLVRLLNPGDFTGEMALFNETTHESYAEAMVATKVCQIRRQDLQTLLVKFPTISLKIMQEMSSRIEASEKQATWVSTESVEARLASFIAENIEEKNGQQTVTLPMTKKDLASYLGTTPETISRKFSEFEEKGLIKQKPKKVIEVLNLDELLLL
ncbi:MAG TPA: Crp/Fnr family transcriptional regulator [Candidatus Tetragenococcus pullicola]|nr:Crp/Fnr family transcriptional regulator [Candidatus Tetragenococcus pullicola]